MRVLLTGSSGLIGSALAQALAERGDVVVPVTRRAPRPGEVGIDSRFERLDTTMLPGGTLEGIGASVHLAGAPIFTRWTAKAREEIRSSRIGLGDLIARSFAPLDRKPSVHVTGSAIGFYGDRGEEVLDEQSAPGVGFLAEVCRAWERAAAPAEALGVRTVAVRTGIVLGPGGALKAMLPLFKLGLGGRLGSGEQWVSWISLEDEVAAILHALDDPGVSGPLNATAPSPVRNSELTEALARILRRPAVVAVPAPVLKAVLGAAAEEMLLASQRVEPRRLGEDGFSFSHPTIELALSQAVG